MIKITTTEKIKNLQSELRDLNQTQKSIERNIKAYNILNQNNISEITDISNISKLEDLNYLKKLDKDVSQYIPYPHEINCIQGVNTNSNVEQTSVLEQYIYDEKPKTDDIDAIIKEKIRQCYIENLEVEKSRLKSTKEQIENIKEQIYQETKKRGLLRTNDYYKSQTPYTKKMQLQQLKNYNNDNIGIILKLLKQVAPSDAKRVLPLMVEGQGKEEIVSLLIGKKLSKHASIALKALTYLVYREHNLGNTESLSTKITVKASDLWQLCNIKKTASGYDHRSKEKIKCAIGELKEHIFYEDKKDWLITSFLLNLHWKDNNKTISFQIEDIFLVNKEDESLSYYYSDLEGCHRLMDITNNSDEAYWLHHYLERAIKSNVQYFNFHVLLEQAGLVNRYKIAKTRIKKLLFSFLDAMVLAKTLIDKWDLVSSDSDEEGKFKLENLRTREKILDLGCGKNQNKKPSTRQK